MIAPKFVETNPTLRRDREKELVHHQKHLRDIVSRTKRLDLSPLHIRRKPGTTGFLRSARQIDIMRENKALFEKLLDISQGKWSPFPITASKLTPKSLNFLNREREVRKITEENSLLADRIVNKHGPMSTKKLLKEYEEMRRYKEHISKAYVFVEGKRKGKVNPSATRPLKDPPSNRVTAT